MTNSLLTLITENAAVIEKSMQRYLGDKDKPYGILLDSMRYSAYSGGKRIRPFLTLETAKMLGGNIDTALPYATAIEMIHTYSLIHDDLPCMDNDDIRRGKPTNHKVYGEATALLAGDALLTYAFSIAAGNSVLTPEQNLSAVKLLANASGHNGMIGGQMLDLIGEKELPTFENFLLMNRLKTGYLIRTACLLGAISAGYSEGTQEYTEIDKYASAIGLAFQIEDDILDIGTEDQKTTFLSFMSVDGAKNEINRLTKEAVTAISSFPRNGALTEFAEYLSSRTV